MRFAVPDGTTHISVQQQEFRVEHGTVDVPDHFERHMLAAGFKRTGEGPIEIRTVPPAEQKLEKDAPTKKVTSG